MEVLTEVIVCYDVTENKRRNQLFKKLKSFGLIDIQKSVFWGRLLNPEIQSIVRLFQEILDPTTDKAFILNTRLKDQIRGRSFGIDPTIFEYREYDII